MVFEKRSRAEKSNVQNLAEAGTHVYFTDFVGSKDDRIPNPITGSWFRIEAGPEATPPQYEFDEVGIVIEGRAPGDAVANDRADQPGAITLRDETGKTETLSAGDTFIVYRGSTISFSTTDIGIAWKCGSRLMARL